MAIGSVGSKPAAVTQSTNEVKTETLQVTGPVAPTPAKVETPAFDKTQRDFKAMLPNEVATAVVPQRAVFHDLGMNDDELKQAITDSIGIRSSAAELPTVEEVRTLTAQGKDVVFSKRTLDEARNLPDLSAELAKRPRIEGVTLSIDHYETTDLDNAVSYRPGEDGTHYVSVTGTDLSAWVRPGSALDFSARRRVETQYASESGLVLPMFPLFLSEGKFSLFEGKERLGKTVELHFSADGKLMDSRIYRSVVKNTHISSADAAEAMAGRGRAETNPELGKALNAMTTLATLVNGGTTGQMQVDKMAALFTTTAAGEVGKALKEAGLEASYRNQAQANTKSIYDEVPVGHAGLKMEAYATFTGPMRRYADIDVQRAIDRMLDGKKPDGRLQQLDHDMRDIELERMNGLVRDPRLKVRKELAEVTRKPEGSVIEELPKPTKPPTAPGE